jgi:hypothetical protein
MVTLRQAQRADLPAAAKVAAAAFVEDPMEQYLYPSHRQHPDRFPEIYLLQFEIAMSDPDFRFMVAVTESSDASWSGKEELVGFCGWFRDREQPSRRVQQEAIFESASYGPSRIAVF